jgi:O-acetyl-ADP-ribose deacetylase (regulator of RNase III)
MKIIEGDITDATEGFIIHQVNCRDAMGSGVAKALFTKWPIVKEQYHIFNKRFVERNVLDRLLGLCSAIPVNTETCVINAYTQNYFGNDGKQYTDYDAIRKVFGFINSNIDISDGIAIPYMYGCGLGGGDWNIVSQIIEDIFGDKAVVYKLSNRWE